mgnify:CR=1 FL=1
MKLVTGTKIYKDTRQLLDEILDTTVNFPNSFKHTIGSILVVTAVEAILIYLIYKEGYENNKK